MLALLVLFSCAPDYGLNPEDDVKGAGNETGNPLDTYDSDGTETGTPDDSEEANVEGEPIADAGEDISASPLDTISLDGTGSWDPNSLQIVAYKWGLTSSPSGSTASLSSPNTVKPSVWLDVAGEYVFELTVQNENGEWDSSPDKVIVNAVPNEGFYVQLSWDTHSDQDLHLLRSGAQVFDVPGDCSWCNLTPSWGQGGTADDPSLHWDTIDEYGPETTTIKSPSNDTYSVLVHYYGQDGYDWCSGQCPPTDATVKVFINGIEEASFTRQMTQQGQVWHVADIKYPGANITGINQMNSTSKIACW